MANPVVTLDLTTFPTLGYAKLTWTNANKGANWYAWRVYRRLTGGTWYLVKEYLVDTASYEFHDFLIATDVAEEWVVVRTFLVGSVITEEAKTPTVSGTPNSDNYWLIHPFNEPDTFLIYQVTSDDFTEEGEMVELKIQGRGRKFDHGTTWGVRGTISCQLRDRTGLSARAQLLRLRLAKENQWFYWLRNPFGDLWRVTIGDIQGGRIAGVGTQEFTDVTFTYAETAA